MTKKLKYTELRSLDSAIAQLQELVDGLRAGVLRLERGEEQLLLKPGAVLDFGLYAERMGAQERFELALEWQRQELTINGAPQRGSAAAQLELGLASSAADGLLQSGPLGNDLEPPLSSDDPPLSSDDDDTLASDDDDEEALTRRQSLSLASCAPDALARDELDDEAVTLRQSSPPEGQLSPSQQALQSDTERYERLYQAARRPACDDRLRFDEKHFARSLAAVGLEPRLRRELRTLAREAAAEGRDRLFKERNISELISSTLSGVA
jgi:amphi-Trp domain-containing protein